MPHAATANPHVPVASPTVAGARVRLRAVTDADATALLEISMYDGVAARTDAEVRAHLERIAADQARRETVHWAIEEAATGVLVGTVGFYRGFADGVGEVGYVLRPDHRGHGYMTEAVALAIVYGFESLDLAAIVAHTDATNAASIAVLERCGFVPGDTDGASRAFHVRRPGADEASRRTGRGHPPA